MTIKAGGIRPKKCKQCGNSFVPVNSLQSVCGLKCAYERAAVLGNKKTVSAWKEKKKEMQEKLMRHSDYIQLLQKVFNTYIRMRDAGLPCISCGTTKKVVYAAGHFYPTTYSYLRFNEDNVHLQCNEHCNRQKRGNLSEYRPALIKKIGLDRVEKLDADRHKELNLSIPEIKDLIVKYKQKIKELKNNKKSNIMKERPILFSTPMVRAILDGRKTMTRRIVKPQPHIHHWEIFKSYKQTVSVLDTTSGPVYQFNDWNSEKGLSHDRNIEVKCPYGQVGDILWVRETWKYLDLGPEDSGFVYKASENGKAWQANDESWTWKSSIHMPKEACRIRLEITNVRVERLKDISEEDAKAEGVQFNPQAPASITNKGSFAKLWQSINGQESWDMNPWVWVIEFKKI